MSQLTAEHQALKARVRELETQHLRTSAEQIEISQLKKKKLLAKDRLELLQRTC